ncbi:hypothetical protein HWI79_2900 [Cryptosporidium felis]|nr:hypothetical protein HWI79_2900 [Cryptosporidium felis]
MGRKSSDGSGVGTDILHALGLNKHINTTDDSETGDQKSVNPSKFKKLTRFSKVKKKSGKVDSSDENKNVDIDLNVDKDNAEIEQANEKTPVSNLLDVQTSFEMVLDEIEKSMVGIKKNVDLAEGCLENIFTAGEKLEKFTELCKVENRDIILGLHKLVDVYKGVALASASATAMEEAKKNGPEKGAERNTEEDPLNKQEGNKFVKADVKRPDANSNGMNEVEINKANPETNVAFVKSKSIVLNKSNSSKVAPSNTVTPELREKPSNVSTNSKQANNEMDSPKSTQSNKTPEKLSTHQETESSDQKSPKEAKISKTERLREKLDNFRIRKGKKEHQDDETNTDSAGQGNNSGQTRMEKFRKKFERKAK